MPAYGMVSVRAQGPVVTAMLNSPGSWLCDGLGSGEGDYLLNPLICTILSAPLALNAAPGLPYVTWAVLTDIGFDGISWLSKEAKNPTRDMLLATDLINFDFDVASDAL